MLKFLKRLFGPADVVIAEPVTSPALTEKTEQEEQYAEPEGQLIAKEEQNGEEQENTDTHEIPIQLQAPHTEPEAEPAGYEYPMPHEFPELANIFSIISEQGVHSVLPVLWSSLQGGMVKDMAELKNIIIAGAQSTGKTNFINQLILSILFSKHPSAVKLILIDSKGLELIAYEKLANNFLTRLKGGKELVVRSFASAVATLNSLCIEMDNRYDLLVDAKAKNISEYNTKIKDRLLSRDAGHQYQPFLVFIIDDFGNYSYQGSAEIFQPYIRLLTQGYKVGIYSIVTTSQTGSKALPGNVLSLIGSRVVFRLNSREECKRFLDTTKFETPQKPGEFLYNENNHVQTGETKYYAQESIEAVVQAVAKQPVFKHPYQLPDFISESDLVRKDFDLRDRDPLFDDAARLIVQSQSGSTSLLQRRMKLGYNQAGRLMDQLEAAGIVGPNQGSKVRDVLIKNEKDLQQQLDALG